MKIEVLHDPVLKTLSVLDTGIGMTKTELITKFGKEAELWRAHDGRTRGSHTMFAAAELVKVVSKSSDDAVQQILGFDTGDTGESIVVGDDPRGDTLYRGTEVTLVLKDAINDFLVGHVETVVSEQANLIPFPILLIDHSSVRLA